MNPSFIIAAVACFLGSIILGLPIGHIFSVVGVPFFGQLTIGIGLGTFYLLWITHNTPVKNRSIVLAFGTYRVRMGPEGKGFTEGLNATPMGWPFMVIQDVFAGETTEKFDQMTAFSKDLVEVKMTGTYNLHIEDAYNTLNITNPYEAVKSLILKWIRAAAEDFTVQELISQEAVTGHSVRSILASNAYAKASAELAGLEARWGYQITAALQVNHIDIDPDFKAALRKIEQMKVEGIYDQTQAERRLAQIRALIGADISPDLAAAVAQVEVGKPGAKINTVNIPGLAKLGQAIGHAVGEAIRGVVGTGDDA